MLRSKGETEENGSNEQIWSGPIGLQLNWLAKGHFFGTWAQVSRYTFSLNCASAMCLEPPSPALWPFSVWKVEHLQLRRAQPFQKGSQYCWSTAGEEVFSSEQAGNRRYLSIFWSVKSVQSPLPTSHHQDVVEMEFLDPSLVLSDLFKTQNMASSRAIQRQRAAAMWDFTF